MIKKQSEEGAADDMHTKVDEMCLCSIGRFAHAKNFDHIPAIAKEIEKEGTSSNGLSSDMGEMKN